jgi:hypothetical protein
MSYQEDLSLIDDGITALANGMAVEVWKDRLAELGLNRQDIKAKTLEVISVINYTYGATIQTELMASGTASKPYHLHESVFEKIVERRTTKVQAELSQIIGQQIMDGGQPAAVVEQNAHPLLDADVLRSAFRKANPEDEVQEEEIDDSSPVSLIIGIVLLLGGIGLTMASSGRTVFYGAVLVGLVMIGKYFIALLFYR